MAGAWLPEPPNVPGLVLLLFVRVPAEDVLGCVGVCVFAVSTFDAGEYRLALAVLLCDVVAFSAFARGGLLDPVVASVVQVLTKFGQSGQGLGPTCGPFFLASRPVLQGQVAGLRTGAEGGDQKHVPVAGRNHVHNSHVNADHAPGGGGGTGLGWGGKRDVPLFVTPTRPCAGRG